MIDSLKRSEELHNVVKWMYRYRYGCGCVPWVVRCYWTRSDSADNWNVWVSGASVCWTISYCCCHRWHHLASLWDNSLPFVSFAILVHYIARELWLCFSSESQSNRTNSPMNRSRNVVSSSLSSRKPSLRWDWRFGHKCRWLAAQSAVHWRQDMCISRQRTWHDSDREM